MKATYFKFVCIHSLQASKNNNYEINFLLFVYRVLHKKLSPFYQSSSKCYNSAVLQELISCLEQHPDWSLAHVASHVGLPECLKHKAIGDSIDSSCSDKKRTPLHLASRVQL